MFVIYFSLILTHSGHLLEVCPFTYCIFVPKNNEIELLIDEMIIMDCSDENIELLVLLKSSSEDERIMKIIEYPCEYSL